MAVCEIEQPAGVVVQFGGQTPLKLAAGLEEAGVPILGTSIDAIDLAEDRSRFGALLDRLGYTAPPLRQRRLVRGGARTRLPASASRCSCGRATCSAGGRWRSSTTSTACATTSSGSASATAGHGRRSTIYLDRFLEDSIEVDVDALCDGTDVWIAGIMQHVEEAGIHSGDSACVIPPHTLGPEMLAEIREQTEGIALALGVVGLLNVQFAIHGRRVCT